MSDFTAAWAWPQWATIISMTLDLLIHALAHGKPRGEYNFPIALIDFAITLFVLICGGFFA